MGDLISRQAALDAMETWDKFGCDPDDKLVRCDDDKHYIPYVHYEDMVHTIKHLPSAQPEPHWIPCGERLPEERGFYLTTTKDKAVYCDYWNEDNFDRTEMVIAWMPLPEAYRGGEK